MCICNETAVKHGYINKIVWTTNKRCKKNSNHAEELEYLFPRIEEATNMIHFLNRAHHFLMVRIYISEDAVNKIKTVHKRTCSTTKNGLTLFPYLSQMKVAISTQHSLCRWCAPCAPRHSAPTDCWELAAGAAVGGWRQLALASQVFETHPQNEPSCQLSVQVLAALCG